MQEHNPSIKYLLVTAFEYELRNHVDIMLMQLAAIRGDLSEKQSDDQKLLLQVREYLQRRIGAMKE